MFSVVTTLSLLFACSPAHAQPPLWLGMQKPPRVTAGLIAYHDFRAGGTSRLVADTSKSKLGGTLELQGKGLTRTKEQGLLVTEQGSAARSKSPATALIKRLKATNQFTVEALITNDNLEQAGPARIVTLSKDTGSRNFTLGQSEDRFAVRLRTTGSDDQGLPEQTTGHKTALPKRQHVLVTFGSGVLRLYINGRAHIVDGRSGDLSNWGDDHHFVVGNENTMDRQWLGQVELVAVYDRALSPDEVRQNVEALGDEELLKSLAEAALDRVTLGQHTRPHEHKERDGENDSK